MENITDIVSDLHELLEDAIEERDWDEVQTISTRLYDLYLELDKNDYY